MIQLKMAVPPHIHHTDKEECTLYVYRQSPSSPEEYIDENRSHIS